MTKKQLVAKLKGLPDDALIILSSDEEGNSYHDLFEVTTEAVTKQGRFYEMADGKQNAIVLWPA